MKQFSSLKNKIKRVSFEKKLFKKSRFNTKKNYLYKDNNNKHVNKMNISHIKTLNEDKIKIKSQITTNKNDNNNNNNYIDEEINGFSYYLAIKYDLRTYFQYYISLIKTQHNLIFAFFNSNDYNSGIIKIDLFFIGFAIEYTVNGLFYTDNTMHKIYESKGDFNLETQLPIAIYSTLISYILNYPLDLLALSNDSIINFKQSNIKFKIKKKVKLLINTLLIKFVIYFIISSLFLLFFWYYISMFGVIYRNTQYHLLKDTLISFGLSLIAPFIFYLLPGICRIPALSKANNRRKCLYNFSRILQSI